MQHNPSVDVLSYKYSNKHTDYNPSSNRLQLVDKHWLMTIMGVGLFHK